MTHVAHARNFFLLALLTAATVLAGCATRSVQPDLDITHFLHDSTYSTENPPHIESQQEVFQLDANIRKQLDEKIGVSRNTHVDGMFLVNQIIQTAKTDRKSVV